MRIDFPDRNATQFYTQNASIFRLDCSIILGRPWNPCENELPSTRTRKRGCCWSPQRHWRIDLRWHSDWCLQKSQRACVAIMQKMLWIPRRICAVAPWNLTSTADISRTSGSCASV